MLSLADILRLRGARSYPRTVVGADPAVNVEATLTVPGGVVWELLTVHIPLTTDANAANRVPTLVIDDGAIIVARYEPPSSIAATRSDRLTWSAGGVNQVRVNNDIGVALPTPPLLLLSGWRVRTLTANLQVGDNYGAPSAYVIETLPGTEGEWGDPHGFRAGRGQEAESLLAGVS